MLRDSVISNTELLPPVIFSINFGIFNCFEIPTEPKISDKPCRFTKGGGGAVAPPEFPPLYTCDC